MKLLFTFFFSLILLFQANSQIFHRYVLNGEVNFLATKSNINYELTPAYSVGIGSSLLFENGYSVNVDALYKPVKFNYLSQFSGDLKGSVDNYLKLHYITFPIQVNLILVDNLSFSTGCNLNFLVDAKTEKYGQIEGVDKTYYFENIEERPLGYQSFVGLYGGVMYKWKLTDNFHMDFKLGIDYGLTSIKQNDNQYLGSIKAGIYLNFIADDKK